MESQYVIARGSQLADGVVYLVYEEAKRNCSKFPKFKVVPRSWWERHHGTIANPKVKEPKRFNKRLTPERKQLALELEADGVIQAKIAKLTGVSQSTICTFLRNHKKK